MGIRMIMRSLVTATFGDPLYIPSVALEGVICGDRVEFPFPAETAFVNYERLCRVRNKLCWLDPVGNNWLS